MWYESYSCKKNLTLSLVNRIWKNKILNYSGKLEIELLGEV